MKKSTATVTWINYRNFGTYLQAYALQQAVEKLGYSNVVIDDSKVISSFPKKKFSPVRILRNIPLLYPQRAEFRRKSLTSIQEFDDFKRNFIKTDADWSTRNELASRYDTYIAGSDQIWSPTSVFDDFYYLGFTDRTKVAYAPSLGTKVYPEAMVPRVRQFLDSFSALSVRERQGADILKEKFSFDAEVVADPTMLLTADDWNALLPETCDASAPYALCYFLTFNRKYVDFAKEYCRSRGLKMVVPVISHNLVGIQGTEELYTGPIGFLKALKGAEVVLTDSFHGTIFSMLFQKPFHTFKRFSDDSAASQNSRLENLLENTGLTDRYLDEDHLETVEDDIDYESVGQSVSNMREKSLAYLRNSLEITPGDRKTAYAAYAHRSEERQSAASGGAASMIAKAFVENGGVVYGCAQEEGAQVRHVRIESVNDLSRLAGSKYVQSQTSEALGLLKEDLKDGRNVLFIGLPCQVAGVRKVCSGYEDRLFTIDLCCHGAPSYGLLASHLQYLGLSSEADKVVFRSKGRSGIGYVFKVYDRNGRCMYDRKASQDWYMAGFLSGLFFREACFTCQFAGPERNSDITLADHWAMGRSDDPQMKVEKGLSTVLINTAGGRKLFESASAYLKYEVRPMTEALRNGQFIRPSDKPADYDDFIGCLKEHGYEAACRKYLPSYMRRMKIHALKSRYYKSPLRQYLRKLLKK